MANKYDVYAQPKTHFETSKVQKKWMKHQGKARHELQIHLNLQINVDGKKWFLYLTVDMLENSHVFCPDLDTTTTNHFSGIIGA